MRGASVFRPGEVLFSSLQTWIRGLPTWLLLTLLAHAPIVLYLVLIFETDVSPPSDTTLIYVIHYGSRFFEFVVAAALMYGVVQKLQGKRANPRRCLGVAVSRLKPILAVAAFFLLAFSLPGFFARGWLAWFLYAAVLWGTARFWVAVPAVVVERVGFSSALGRSLRLTEGVWIRVFSLPLLLVVIERAGYWAVSAWFQRQVVAHETSEGLMRHWRLSLYGGYTFAILVSSLRAVTMGVAYAQLRRAKEGMSVEELARVFD